VSLPSLFFLPSRPVSLTNLAITSLGGPDRAKYLQGQVTCDVNALQPGQSTLGGHCDPKGKLWSDFRLLCLKTAC
jgi:folate-binding Fe-S cluster repair protein YgfZ